MARHVRPVRPGLDLIAAAFAVVLIASPESAAQQRSTYSALVDQYAQGDAAGALRELARWSASEVRNVTDDDRLRFVTPPRQRAAVMLHTEMANAWLQARATSDASLHLNVARRMLTIMKHGGRGDERTQVFERRWYAFVASMYTSQGVLNQAELIVRDGLSVYGRDARLFVARGAIREMDATLTTADPNGGPAVRTNRWFESAAADYRRAIDYDDTLATAHLHLGWTRLRGQDDRSLHDFESALEHADDDGTRYLAHLFLGAFAERKNNLDDASGHYEAALALGPAYQTAYVALSHVEEARGHSARARDLARMYAALAVKEEDPWWNYHLGGFDQPTLEWLRREAMAP